eukprot:3436419-Pyramimonas_sp.AAC.1
MGWAWRSIRGCSEPWEQDKEARGPPERAVQAAAAVGHLMQSGKLLQSAGINGLLGWFAEPRGHDIGRTTNEPSEARSSA